MRTNHILGNSLTMALPRFNISLTDRILGDMQEVVCNVQASLQQVMQGTNPMSFCTIMDEPFSFGVELQRLINVKLAHKQ